MRLTIAVLISILFITIVFFVIFSLVRIRKHLRSVQNLNKEIEYRRSDLEQAFSSLEKSHTENSKLLLTVGHDLKNSLGGIKTLAYTLGKQVDNESMKESISLIEVSSKSSLTLINDLLTSAITEKNELKEPTDLYRLADYCINMLSEKAKEKDQKIILTGSESVISINMEGMWRVISNLINNAIKFSPSGEVIRVVIEDRPMYSLMKITDNGIGIPADFEHIIFDYKTMGKQKGTKGEESFGLGLSICKKIITDHGGEIWFDSIVGKGTTFFVELPK